MKVNEFIEKYKNSNDKEKYLAKHITNKYVSYATKIDECKRIVEASSYKEVGDEKVYYKNTPAQLFQFVLRLIINYTDIEIGEDVVKDFDLLNESGLLDLIIINIPEPEYEQWKTILHMVDDDLYENLRSIPAYFDTKFAAMNLVFDSFSSVLGQYINNEELQKFIKENV